MNTVEKLKDVAVSEFRVTLEYEQFIVNDDGSEGIKIDAPVELISYSRPTVEGGGSGLPESLIEGLMIIWNAWDSFIKKCNELEGKQMVVTFSPATRENLRIAMEEAVSSKSLKS